MKRREKLLLLLSALFLFSACEKTAEIAEEPFPAEDKSEAVTSRKAVLAGGNYWTEGISGFGANRFYALAGEYRLEGPASFGEEPFRLFLTREPLYFSGEWEAVPGTPLPGTGAVTRNAENGSFFSAVVLEDDRGVPWKAVFEFPRGLPQAGLDGDSLTLLLRAWTVKALYFLSLSKSAADISLPAVVEF